jgi:hypothetical protein
MGLTNLDDFAAIPASPVMLCYFRVFTVIVKLSFPGRVAASAPHFLFGLVVRVLSVRDIAVPLAGNAGQGLGGRSAVLVNRDSDCFFTVAAWTCFHGFPRDFVLNAFTISLRRE